MAEYIDREAAIKEVYRFDGYLDDDMEWRLHYALKKLPAADVVEVVRCGECIRKGICRTSNVWAVSPDDDWFCADGEPKGGGQEPPEEVLSGPEE